MATQIRGAQIRVAYAGDGLGVSGNVMSVNVDNSSIEIAGDVLRVKNLGITNAMISGAIADDKLDSVYVYADGTRPFSGTVSGVTPTEDAHLATKLYVDNQLSLQDDHNELNNIQGGAANQYYHLTGTQHELLTGVSGVVNATSLHIHDDRYYTESEVDTISGALSDEIDAATASGAIDHGNLAGLSDNDHTQYLMTATDPLNVTGQDVALTVSGTDLGVNGEGALYVKDSGIDHNSTSGLQGGDASNRWHLDANTYNALSSDGATLTITQNVDATGNVNVSGTLGFDGDVTVNEILDSNDSIDASSTDDQLATAKLIYTTYSGLSAAQGGTPTYMYYVDDNGNIAETGTMTFTEGTYTWVDQGSDYPNGYINITSGTLFIHEDGLWIHKDVPNDWTTMQLGGDQFAGDGLSGPCYVVEGQPSDSTQGQIYAFTGRSGWYAFSADRNSVNIGGSTASEIVVSYTNDNILLQASQTTEMTIGTGGMALKNSTVDVNEILNTVDADSIGPASTDDQLATAKLIYDYVDTVSGAMVHNDLEGLQGGTANEYYHLTENEHQLLTAVSGAEDATSLHIHDSRYYTETEVDTISGSLQSDIIWEIVDTPTTQIRPKIAHLQKAIYTEGNVTIGGDLTVTGTLFYTNTEIVQVSDNIMHINYGEVGAGVTAGEAGIQVDRGSETDYYFVFDEGTDTFRVGVSGSQDAFNSAELQPVATREDSPTDTRVTWWDDTHKTLRTQGDTYITVNSGTDTIVFGASNTTEMTIDTGGMALKAGADVNEILDSGDSISDASTDDQLATAKLIYDYIVTVTGSQIHNNLLGLQGGNATERYHMTSAQHTALTDVGGVNDADGQHSHSSYLTSFSETDPVFGASAAAGITTTNISNWNTAYGWGDHAGLYLTSFTETDPVFGASAAAGITATNISNWNTAYGWGDWSLQTITVSGGDGLTTTGSPVALGGTVELDVNVDNSTIEINADILRVKAAGITEAHLNTSVAGDGLTGGGGTPLSVVTGSGITTVDDTVILNPTVAGDGLAYTGGILSVNVDDSTIEISADTLQVVASGITEPHLAIVNAPVTSGVLSWNGSGMEWVNIDAQLDTVTEGDIRLDNFTATVSGQSGFTLSYTPVDNSVQIFLNGLLQEKGGGKDYTQSGTAITFGIAPEAGDILIAHYVSID